ncbi:hypothetical protein M0805_009572 [Coniferiporia weirii]|nr:hypothetical protein M0805_009572 [Coniferiporia weirii]
MATSHVVPVNLDLTLGALQVGTYISTTLFGIMSMQTYYFYVNFPNERKLLKGLVACIWIFELVHTVLVARSAYEMSVTNFGSFSDFVETPFPLAFSIVWSATVSCTIQAFFAYRIRVMSQRWEIALVSWALSLVHFVNSAIATTKELDINNLLVFDDKWEWVITVPLVVGATNDVIIAAGLSYYLHRSRSGMPSTNKVIHRLILFTIQTGLVTSIFAIMMLIFFLAMSDDNFLWLCIFVFLAKGYKVYSNSLLATLNARSGLRSKNTGNASINGIGYYPSGQGSVVHRDFAISQLQVFIFSSPFKPTASPLILNRIRQLRLKSGSPRVRAIEEAVASASGIGAAAQQYLKVMKKLINGSAEYLNKESARLASILKRRTLSAEKLNELKIKANVLAAFTHEKIVEPVEEEVDSSTQRAKEEL